MTFRRYHTKRRIPIFYNQGVVYVYWSRFLAITCEITVISAPFALAWALFTPRPVAVNSQAKITFSDFEHSKSSNTFYGWVKLTRRSIQPILTLIQSVITRRLSNGIGLQLDGVPSADVLLSDAIRLTAASCYQEKESV